MSDSIYEQAQTQAPPAPKPQKPLWRRILVGAVLAGVAVFAAFHLYALILRFAPTPGTILMTQRAMQGEDVRRDWVSLDKISPRLVYAVIAAEDAKFCTHGGIDWDAIEQAREYNARNPGKRRRGGSTISQQTAKNVFFWNGGGMPRKAGEAWMTYVIETVWGKRRIMEMYLNVAEWGDGLFGAEAAAQARFGKSAADLTEREAALLAAVLPSPNKWSADNPGPYVRRRASSIQGRMRVVANEGYAACVFGGEVPKLPPGERPSGDTPRPPPVLEDIPEAPETGDEALETPTEEEGTDVPRNANDELNDLLNSADQTFTGEPLPEPAPPSEAAPETSDVPAAEPAAETPADPAPADPQPEQPSSGPAELRPPE
ncbi:monofunctional biosynthetic peptidoglycan transglycosylase [Hyphomonas sp. WL0036]|uniref:monofunctional biosynthetic peptidoglycan transglycosylase n=1 Tax=Hyphomonas sediminis TaxID=2866160 RepID=UPI001C80B680|nr:monofunctional biosynthetic peptidoglycan transglycosylase [Hyphomonas sediminis]MBY9066458.1 monofunctional biosynthetic peptidoglycan transglycosylase [Hyphomonas sediminis]